MICDHCHKNEATIHMTNIVNNQKTEQHLCNTCATALQQEGKLSPYSSFMNDMWDDSFFTNDFFSIILKPPFPWQAQGSSPESLPLFQARRSFFRCTLQ